MNLQNITYLFSSIKYIQIFRTKGNRGFDMGSKPLCTHITIKRSRTQNYYGTGTGKVLGNIS